MEKRTVLIPEYMRHFSCIGSACEDTCCSGWQITIDQKTYNTYKEVNENESKPSLIQHMKKIDSNSTSEHFAEIILRESDSCCPLLNEAKLCSVHAQMGERFLSNLCVTYPRVSNVVNGIYERSATVSCPEAARVVLLNKDGIVFEEIEEHIEERHLIVKRLDTKGQKALDSAQRYFLELRTFFIQVLQNRNYPITERLLIIGMFMEKVQEIVNSRQIDDIPNLILSYKDLIDNGVLRKSIDKLPTSIRTQIEIARKLIDMRLFSGVKDKRFLQCLMEALEGINYTGQILKEESVENYIDIYHHSYLSFMEKHEYIFENYLVNYTFKNLFPVRRKVNKDYLLLVVHFALIKMLVIGMMGYHRESFNIDHIITLIQSFSRVVEHSPSELGRFQKFLLENGFDDISNLAMLVKN